MSNKIKVELDRKDVKRMVSGLSPATMSKWIELEKIGFMKFTGNQWNEKWDWNWDKLDEKAPTAKRLFEFYTHMKTFNNNINRKE